MGLTFELEETEKANISEIKEMLLYLIKKENSSAWLTDEMVMERFAVSRTTLHRWRQDGMPYCQEGSIRRYVPSEIDSWFYKFRTACDSPNDYNFIAPQKAA